MESELPKPWYYESGGARKGGHTEEEMIDLVKAGDIRPGTVVWQQGFTDWTKVEETDLATHLDLSGPPPLSGDHVNNTIIWVLAFAPIIGLILEGIVAGMVYGGNEYRIQAALSNAQFWYITLILNIGLSLRDEKMLEKSGIDTSKFKGMVWLVPVYLYQRSKALGQNLAYFIVWIVSFVLMLTV